LKGNLAFLLEKGGKDKETSNFLCKNLGLGIARIANGDFTKWSFKNGITGLSVQFTHGGDLEIYNALTPG